MPTVLDKDNANTFQVETPAGDICVRLLEWCHLVVFREGYVFQADAGVLQRRRLINRLNRKALLPRFREEDDPEDGYLLISEYAMSYRHGLIPNQFAWVLQQFAHQSRRLIQLDTENLLL